MGVYGSRLAHMKVAPGTSSQLEASEELELGESGAIVSTPPLSPTESLSKHRNRHTATISRLHQYAMNRK